MEFLFEVMKERYVFIDLQGSLRRFASEQNIVRYAKIAMQLKDKTVRDVALRCRWLTVSSTVSTGLFLLPFLADMLIFFPGLILCNTQKTYYCSIYG